MNFLIIPYILKASFAGGIVAVDETSFGQFMISRPVAAGFITGLITGELFFGTLIGALFELLYLDVLPVGGARFPSAGLAAVCAVSLFGLFGFDRLEDAGGSIPLFFLFSGLAASIGGWLVIKVRKVNTRMAGIAISGVRDGNFSKLTAVQLGGIVLSFCRGFFVIFAVLTVVHFLRVTVVSFTSWSGSASAFLLVPFAALGLTVALKTFITRRRILHLLLGGCITLLFLYMS